VVRTGSVPGAAAGRGIVGRGFVGRGMVGRGTVEDEVCLNSCENYLI
jgi:hypothetical protein